jgi:hypothetical protein
MDTRFMNSSSGMQEMERQQQGSSVTDDDDKCATTNDAPAISLKRPSGQLWQVLALWAASAFE